MTSEDTLELAHREAWRYKKSSDPHHSDTYTFNRSTLIEFARKLEEQAIAEALVSVSYEVAAEREACAALCEELVTHPAGHGGQWEGYGPVKTQRDGKACAAAIRARSNV